MSDTSESAPRRQKLFNYVYVLWLALWVPLGIAAAEGALRWLGFVPAGELEVHPCPGNTDDTCTQGSWTKGPAWLFGSGAFVVNRLRHRAGDPTKVRCDVPIVFLGDSYTFGQFLSQQDALPQAVARALGPELSNCVYNAGEVGSSLAQQRVTLRQFLEIEQLVPRILIHQFSWDDPYQHAGRLNELVEAFHRDHFHLIGISLAAIRLKLDLAWKFDWMRNRPGPAGLGGTISGPEPSELMTEYAGSWGEFMDEIRSRGIEPIEIAIPFAADLASGNSSSLQPLLQAAVDRGIPVLVPDRRNLDAIPFLVNDLHFNAEANKEIADLLLPLIHSALHESQPRVPVKP